MDFFVVGLFIFFSGMWLVWNKCFEKVYGMRLCKYLNYLLKVICRELELVDVDVEKKIINFILLVLMFEVIRFLFLKFVV